MAITERGRWSGLTVDARGKRVFSTGLNERGTKVFGLAPPPFGISGGSVSGGTAVTPPMVTVNYSVSGGSVSNGTASGIAFEGPTANGGSTTGGQSASVSVLTVSVIGGSSSGILPSVSDNNTALTFVDNTVITINGGSLSDGKAIGIIISSVNGSVTGGSISGGKAQSNILGSINGMATGGSLSGGSSKGNITLPGVSQTGAAQGGSISNGSASGLISVGTATINVSGGAITGGQAFAALLQKAMSTGGSKTGGKVRVGQEHALIGRIELKASQELRIKLNAKQELRITLRGGLVTAKNQNFTMTAGDSKYLDFPADFVVSAIQEIKWALKRSVSSSTNDIYKQLSTGGITVDVANQQFTVALSPADTENLIGDYYHEAEITDTAGNVSTVTIGRGTFEASGV